MNEFLRCVFVCVQACPLNPDPNEAREHKWEDFSDSFTPAIQSIVDFAKGIPGFTVLNQEDQVILLKVSQPFSLPFLFEKNSLKIYRKHLLENVPLFVLELRNLLEKLQKFVLKICRKYSLRNLRKTFA